MTCSTDWKSCSATDRIVPAIVVAQFRTAVMTEIVGDAGATMAPAVDVSVLTVYSLTQDPAR
jgi:hypothetical protein